MTCTGYSEDTKLNPVHVIVAGVLAAIFVWAWWRNASVLGGG